MTELDSKLQESGASVDDEGFAGRWSRLKRQSGESSVGVTPVARQPEIEQSEPQPEPTDQDMPALDSLTADSDFSPFLSPKVSESLRRLALRKLFHGDAFNVCDGLDDYAEDFTHFSSLGSVVTADMKHQLQRLLDKEKQEAEAKKKPEAEAEETPAAVAGTEATADGDPTAMQLTHEPQPAAETGAAANDQDEVERT